jgi:hypothetical protein
MSLVLWKVTRSRNLPSHRPFFPILNYYSYDSVRRLEKKQNGKFQLLSRVFSDTDASIKSGTIGLYSWLNRGSIFDDVLVEDLKTGQTLLFDDFKDGNFAGWTLFDDAVGGERSAWKVTNGMATQSSNVGSRASGQPGSFALYTN